MEWNEMIEFFFSSKGAAVVAFLSALGAIFAACFSYKSATAAKRQAKAAETASHEAMQQTELAHKALHVAKNQNEIAIHGHCLDVYKAFLAFRSDSNVRPPQLNQELVWALWAQASLADFYFSEDIGRGLDNIVKLAIAIQAKDRQLAVITRTDDQDIFHLNLNRDDLYEKLNVAMEKSNLEMRNELRIASMKVL
jgi:hypothetical protein